MKKFILIIALVAICAGIVQALTSDGTGTNNGYFYTLWHQDGSVNMTLGSGGNYSVTWSNANIVCGKGWNPGGSRTISWSGSASGAQFVGVYGWMTSPLIEYYIGKSGGTTKGTYTAGGRSYTLQITRRTNQPSIQGTASFDQYNCSGSASSPVDFGAHLTGWRNIGASIGSHNYQIVAVEGWGHSSGNANITVGGSSSSSSSSSSGGSSKTIVVRACESGSAGSGAQIRLTVNNQTVATWTLTSTSMSNFSASTTLSGGCNVQYINDTTNRDVRVDYIQVNGSTRQAESQSTNTAVYQNGSCGGSNSEWMHCNGYIGFGNV